MNVFIGLDVSLASTAICVLGPQGRIVEELQAESEPEALVRAIASLSYSIDAIGLEAGPLSQWLSKGMEEAGFDVVMMETRLVKAALKAMPIKTDRRDAQGIAACFKWNGTGPCTANLYPPRKSALCSPRENQFNRQSSTSNSR